MFKLCLRLAGEMVVLVFRGPWRFGEIGRQIVLIGVESLPIIAVATAFAGFVVTHEIAWHMDHALHNVGMIPGFTGQFIVRELGIAIPGLLVVSKVGAAIAAEIGTMRVTDQIDALRLLGIEPVSYLVFPRWVAGIVSVVCLTFFAVALTTLCAMGVAITQYGFSTLEYINLLRPFVGLRDGVAALVKSSLFGAVIPLISCAYGMRCEGGAQGVGNATTQSVVVATLAVIVLDFAVTAVFALLV